MQIDNALISKLEILAHLKLESDEKTAVTRDLNAILAMIDRMNELDTEAVEPLVYLHENTDMLRKDTISGQIDLDSAMKNSADHTKEFFKVPKIIQKENTAG